MPSLMTRRVRPSVKATRKVSSIRKAEPASPVKADPIPSSPIVESLPVAARYTERNLSVRSTKELKAICKDNHWTGYSTMNKSQIIILILSGGQRSAVPSKADVPTIKGPSVAALKAECKDRQIRGISKLNRAELVRALEDGNAPKHVARVGTVDWLRSLATRVQLVGRSKLKGRDALIRALSANTDARAELIEAGIIESVKAAA